MSSQDTRIKCRLCAKVRKFTFKLMGYNEIDIHSEVCNDCRKLWELGKKVANATKKDGDVCYATVNLVIKVDGRNGDPAADTSVSSGDVIAAMGAAKLRGTEAGSRFRRPENPVRIGVAGKGDHGGDEVVQVPKARALAMSKLLRAFHNALAKVRIDGFNEGRNLLRGLADGSLRIDDFSEQSDNANAGRKPRGDYY